MSKNLYQCQNDRCALGSRSEAGLFTGGISKEQAEQLSGDPDASSGPGYCPNCGEKGKKVGEH